MGNAKQELVDLVRSHAGRPGGGSAVEQGGRSVGYDELSTLVERRAAALAGEGAAGALVAVERRKSPAYVVDVLAVLALRGTVVPVDPDTPVDRRATFLDLARPALLVDGTGVTRLAGARTVHEDGGFVFFTSGSTGVPKPVLGSAAAVLGFARWFAPEFGLGPGDRVAFLTGLSFEASLRDLVPTLTSGATLVIPDDADVATPEATVAWLAARRVTVVTVVPSVARGWLRAAPTTCPSVRAAFFIGEPPAADVLAGWRATFPGTAVRVNSYGSTESGQATVFNRVPDAVDGTERVPAGKPVPGTRYCFVDPDAPLSADVVRARLDDPATGGEIVLVSRSGSHGYLGMPAEQAARFADLGDGVTAYRTGDLGRVDERGDLVVVGRADDEVKITGVRVHPAEVTRAVRACDAVADAFVVATKDEERGARLTAYVVPADPGGLALPALRAHLLDTLPPAMIPARFVEVADLPTTRTGKVDRAALTALAAAPPADQPYVPPSGEVECWLADRFAELLGVGRVSATDDLFALGGDSMTATALAARAWRDLGVELTQRDVFAGATVGGIAAVVVERELLAADPHELLALLDALDDETGDETDDDARRAPGGEAA